MWIELTPQFLILAEGWDTASLEGQGQKKKKVFSKDSRQW